LIGDDPLPNDRISGSHNPYYRSWSKLPLLSWEQATGWPDRVTHHEVFSYVSTESNVTEHAFAVRVEDNTMKPRYPEGTLLIIEPSLRAHDKDFALVHVDGQKKAQFKQVLFDGEDLYLKPLNKDFEIKKVDGNYAILGIMVQSLTEYYQDRLPAGEETALDSKPPVKKRKDKAFADTDAY
jgi:SOS-response transcriptional repressor LexA